MKEQLKKAVPDHKKPSTQIGLVAMVLAGARMAEPDVDWDGIYDAAMYLWDQVPALYALIGGLGIWKFFSKD